MSELISCSAEAIEGKDYLLTQILIRLPLKHIMTFKRVSKRWRFLIFTPYFRRCHHTLKSRVSGLFLLPHPGIDSPPYNRFSFFSFDKKTLRPAISNPSDSFQILQSCNGLMLVQRRFTDNYLICNPTIGDRKSFPSPFPWFDKLNSTYYYSLAFDPLCFLGYKLICIFRPCSPNYNDEYQTMIYSSESSGTWKHCGSSFSASLDMDFAHGTYSNYSVYWICNESKTALRFDLNKECMKDDLPLLPSPKPAESHYLHPYRYVLAPACGYMNLVGHADSEYCPGNWDEVMKRKMASRIDQRYRPICLRFNLPVKQKMKNPNYQGKRKNPWIDNPDDHDLYVLKPIKTRLASKIGRYGECKLSELVMASWIMP
ncbi:hypothetical protein PIB30_075213 [Stylosanthes scabra]|uniref:F-box domain-containing protein n=1 Tax=Stylosanthes scabra TaxID=79078 RepID=A0ABU6UPE2_9FABA|nr:hypothetical protein [Stylosanthes scabra]